MQDKDTQNHLWLQTLERAIREGQLIARGEAVVAAVSGGADSVAMLASLQALARREDCSWRLTVAHLNHGIRADAGEDEAFVADLARQRGLPFVSHRRNVLDEAKQNGKTLEEAARDARYEFLLDVAVNNNCTRVAVAHHADDNAETIVHRIARGTHLRGLAGMPACRDMGKGVKLIRPMLGLTRRDIEEYLRRNHLAWRNDSTNADTAYSRNCIRHEILPLLAERLNPRVQDALLRLASSVGEVESFMEALAEETLVRACVTLNDGRDALRAEVLACRPAVLRRYVFRLALERAGLGMRQVGTSQLERLSRMVDDLSVPAVCVPGGFIVRREGELLVIGRSENETVQEGGLPQTVLAVPGRTVLADGRIVVCEIMAFNAAEFEAHCRRPSRSEELLDARSVCGELTCRSRRDGDWFTPLGGPGGQSVSDFLTNSKIPAARRGEVLCVSDEEGIVYVSPLRMDDRVKVTADTHRVLRIFVEKQPGLRAGT